MTLMQTPSPTPSPFRFTSEGDVRRVRVKKSHDYGYKTHFQRKSRGAIRQVRERISEKLQQKRDSRALIALHESSDAEVEEAVEALVAHAHDETPRPSTWGLSPRAKVIVAGLVGAAGVGLATWVSKYLVEDDLVHRVWGI
jgi:hypothetical protein